MYDLLFLVPSPLAIPSPAPEFLKVPGWLALEWSLLLSVVVASASFSSPSTLPFLSPPPLSVAVLQSWSYVEEIYT